MVSHTTTALPTGLKIMALPLTDHAKQKHCGTQCTRPMNPKSKKVDTDLGGCRGTPPQKSFFFVFAFKICLPHQSLVVHPLLRIILDLPLKSLKS